MMMIAVLMLMVVMILAFLLFKADFLGYHGSAEKCCKNKQRDLDSSLHQVKEISVIQVFIYYCTVLDPVFALFHEMYLHEVLALVFSILFVLIHLKEYVLSYGNIPVMMVIISVIFLIKLFAI